MLSAVFKTVCGALLRRPGWVRFPSIPAKSGGRDSQHDSQNRNGFLDRMRLCARLLAPSAGLDRWCACGPKGWAELGPSPEALGLVTVFAWSPPVVRQVFDFRETPIKRDRKRIGELSNKPAIAAKHAEGQEL